MFVIDLVKNKCAGHIDGFLASGGSVKDIIGTLPAPELVEKVSQIKYTFRTLFKVLVRFVFLILKTLCFQTIQMPRFFFYLLKLCVQNISQPP